MAAIEKRFPYLCSAADIGDISVDNRVVMASMCTNMATVEGEVTDQLVAYYQERAKGGVGLIITEFICVDSPIGKYSPSQLCLHNDSLIAGHGRLTEAIHLSGSKIMAQLHHGGCFTPLRVTGQTKPICVSASAENIPPVVQELDLEGINQIAQKFAATAKRAMAAGYDGVELHGAHGYLLNQFLSPYYNKRQDEYGGNTENRARILKDIITAVRESTGKVFTITIRISAMEYVEGGLCIEESGAIARLAESYGYNAIHVSHGNMTSRHKIVEGMDEPEGPRIWMAAEIKKEVKIPVIAVGNIRDPYFAEKVLQEGKADFIALGRPLLCDPFWTRKVEENRLDEIRPCISCKQCSFSSRIPLQTSCLINPLVGKEREKIIPVQTGKPKKIIIIGGGPAGVQAAISSAARGHEVKLYEKLPGLLEGQLAIACKPPGKQRISWLKNYLLREVGRYKSQIDVCTGCEVDIDLLSKLQADVIILATGAEPVIPNFKGMEKVPVYTAWDVLAEKHTFQSEDVIAIIGGYATGCETAEYLAEKGHRVIITSRSPLGHIGRGPIAGFEDETRQRVLKNPMIEVLSEYEVEQIKDNEMVINSKSSDFTETRTVNGFVVARGVKPVNKLLKHVKDIFMQSYIIGDCKKPRNIKCAIHEGFHIGREV